MLGDGVSERIPDFFPGFFVGAVLAIAGVFIEITIKGLRKNRIHPHQASHPADHRVT